MINSFDKKWNAALHPRCCFLYHFIYLLTSSVLFSRMQTSPCCGQVCLDTGQVSWFNLTCLLLSSQQFQCFCYPINLRVNEVSEQEVNGLKKNKESAGLIDACDSLDARLSCKGQTALHRPTCLYLGMIYPRLNMKDQKWEKYLYFWLGIRR